jgi:hypothetical protein
MGEAYSIQETDEVFIQNFILRISRKEISGERQA